jgi:spore maturation protein CgeB
MYKHFTQPNVVFPEQIKQEKKSRKSTKNGLKHLTKKDHHSKELSEKKKGLLRVAKKYRITELISRYVNICKSMYIVLIHGWPTNKRFSALL